MKYQQTAKSVQKEQSKTSSSAVHQTSLNHVAVHPLPKLQQTIGNQAVQKTLCSGNVQFDPTTQAFIGPRFGHDFSRTPVYSSRPPVFQTKLNVNQPGDIYEQEADQVAEQDFSQVRPSAARGDLYSQGKLPRLRQEIPLQLGFDLQRGRNSSQLDDTVSNLSPGRPLSQSLRNRLPDAPQSAMDEVRVHDDPQSRATADLLNSEGLAYRRHIVLGSTARNSDWLTAHELGHVLQQSSPTLVRGVTEPAILEHEADQFADTVMSQAPSSAVRALPLSPASPGLAQKVIWKHIQDLPADLLLILDVDDGDFVGGCVRAVVPHVGVKLIKKFPHMQLFNLHVGFLTNPAGEFCIFFYESVTGICETLCFPSKQKLRDSWEKVKEWLKEMIEKLLQALAIAALLAVLVILAYLIAQAIVAALLILLAA